MDTVIRANFDGCCEPFNPRGYIGIGAVIFIDGNKVEIAEYLPAQPGNSNNLAEYGGLMAVLKYLRHRELHERRVIIQGDSQLVVKQMAGEWKIKQGKLYSKSAWETKRLLMEFSECQVSWISREHNTEADELSKRQLRDRDIEVVHEALFI